MSDANELKQKLLRLPVEMRKAIQAEMLKQGNKLASAMRQKVHVDSGKTRASIKVTAGELSSEVASSLLHATHVDAGSAEVAFSLGSGSATVNHPITVTVTAGGPTTTTHSRAGSYDHALGEEYGTTKMRPRPFFFSTYRTMEEGIEAAIGDSVAKALKANGGD